MSEVSKDGGVWSKKCVNTLDGPKTSVNSALGTSSTVRVETFLRSLKDTILSLKLFCETVGSLHQHLDLCRKEKSFSFSR